MRIYVGGLSYSVNNEGLRALFAEIGEVTDATVVMDRFTRESKGFGFVEMPNIEEARTAISRLNGKSHAGRNLTVNEAKPARRAQRWRWRRWYERVAVAAAVVAGNYGPPVNQKKPDAKASGFFIARRNLFALRPRRFGDYFAHLRFRKTELFGAERNVFQVDLVPVSLRRIDKSRDVFVGDVRGDRRGKLGGRQVHVARTPGDAFAKRRVVAR